MIFVLKKMHLFQSPNQWGALGLTLVTSSIVFLRRTLVLEKFVWKFKLYHYVTWGISLASGILFWATLNALNSTLWLQLMFGVTSTTLSWVVYVLLTNEDLIFPSQQQWISLGFYAITEAMLLIQVRLVLEDRREVHV